MSGSIHWHEGLFLQPHHLQAMQRQQMERAWAERRLWHPYPSGLIEARVSTDALENMMVRVDRLRAIMPSGLEVSAPDLAEIPALDIKRTFAASTAPILVRLGVPLWYADRANAIPPSGSEDWRVRRMYRVTETTRSDENTGENPQPMLMRKINARLLLPDDDDTDLETLPILRIAHGAGDDIGLPRVDGEYMPPCLLLTGSPALRDLVRGVANEVDATRKELVLQLGRSGFSVDTMRGAQFEQMLRLRTVSRFAARLPHIAVAPGTTPFEAYLELRELLGELAALRPDRDRFDAPAYQHENPAAVFPEIRERIREVLRPGLAPKFLQVKLIREEDYFIANLTDEHLTAPNDYFLAVTTNEDPTVVARLVEDPDKFKVMAKTMIRRPLFGVRLKEERHPPLELPTQGKMHYFRLMRADSQKMWDVIREHKALAVRWLDIDTSDFQLTLYMTVPGN